MSAELDERQPRERSVTCRVCCRRETWDRDATCDVCKSLATPNALQLRQLQRDRENAALETRLAEEAFDAAQRRRLAAVNAYIAADRAVKDFASEHPL